MCVCGVCCVWSTGTRSELFYVGLHMCCTWNITYFFFHKRVPGTDAVISSTCINNTLYGLNIILFILWQKSLDIRIMKIFSTFPIINIFLIINALLRT